MQQYINTKRLNLGGLLMLLVMLLSYQACMYTGLQFTRLVAVDLYLDAYSPVIFTNIMGST